MTRWIGGVGGVWFEHLLHCVPSPNETESGGSRNTQIVVRPASGCQSPQISWSSRLAVLFLQFLLLFLQLTVTSIVPKPVVEWNKLHLKHHLPVWGLWPESETKSSKSNQKQEFSRNNPRIPSHLLSGAFGDLIRGKLMEWNSYAGRMDVLDTKWRENGCGFCVYMGKFLTCAFVVVLVGGKKTLS